MYDEDLLIMMKTMDSLDLTSETKSGIQVNVTDTNQVSRRKPSLPQAPTYSKGNSNIRKSLFIAERSFSSSNLTQLPLRVRKDSKFNFTVSEGASIFTKKEKPNNPVTDILNDSIEDNVYDTFDPTPSRSSGDNHNTNLDPVKTDDKNILVNHDDLIDNNFLTIDSAINIREPRGSIENKNKRLSNLSEKGYNQPLFSYGNLSQLKSAPESARNSSIAKTESEMDDKNNINTINKNQMNPCQLSLDSGINSAPINDAGLSSDNSLSPLASTLNIGYQQQQKPTSLSSESGSDYSKSNQDSMMLINDKNYFGNSIEIEDDRHDFTLKMKPTDSDFESLKVCKPVKTKEDQVQFFQQISKTISESSYLTKEIIRFYRRDGTFTSQIIDQTNSAFDVCVILRRKFNVVSNSFCQIVEIINTESLERTLEDHENILDVYYSWSHENTLNQFIFQENVHAYKIFTQPSAFETEMQCDFELNEDLWIKEPRGKWKKVPCFILDSILYFKAKPGSKDHKDLFCLVNIKNIDFYICVDQNRIKKVYKSPTTELIVFKSDKLEHKSSEHACIAATSGIQKEKWFEAIKIAKFGFKKLKNNYLKHEQSFLIYHEDL